MFISNDNKIYLVCDSGYDLILLEMTEFQKIDGSLTCLSLRFWFQSQKPSRWYDISTGEERPRQVLARVDNQHTYRSKLHYRDHVTAVGFIARIEVLQLEAEL